MENISKSWENHLEMEDSWEIAGKLPAMLKVYI